MEPDELFIDDILCFARAAVKRIKADHRFYKRDLALGAFDMSQKRYR